MNVRLSLPPPPTTHTPPFTMSTPAFAVRMRFPPADNPNLSISSNLIISRTMDNIIESHHVIRANCLSLPLLCRLLLPRPILSSRFCFLRFPSSSLAFLLTQSFPSLAIDLHGSELHLLSHCRVDSRVLVCDLVARFVSQTPSLVVFLPTHFTSSPRISSLSRGWGWGRESAQLFSDSCLHQLWTSRRGEN